MTDYKKNIITEIEEIMGKLNTIQVDLSSVDMGFSTIKLNSTGSIVITSESGFTYGLGDFDYGELDIIHSIILDKETFSFVAFDLSKGWSFNLKNVTQKEFDEELKKYETTNKTEVYKTRLLIKTR